MKDLNGKKVKLGCKLKSKMFPNNEVECVGFENGRPLLQQKHQGAAYFEMPKKSQWIVYEDPPQPSSTSKR